MTSEEGMNYKRHLYMVKEHGNYYDRYHYVVSRKVPRSKFKIALGVMALGVLFGFLFGWRG